MQKKACPPTAAAQAGMDRRPQPKLILMWALVGLSLTLAVCVVSSNATSKRRLTLRPAMSLADRRAMARWGAHGVPPEDLMTRWPHLAARLRAHGMTALKHLQDTRKRRGRGAKRITKGDIARMTAMQLEGLGRELRRLIHKAGGYAQEGEFRPGEFLG